MDSFFKAAMGMGTWSKAANSVIKDPYISQVALWIEQKKCQAYNICYNPIQEAIKNKDMTRITDGALLILDGVGKTTAGGFLTLASIPMLASGGGTGFGAAGILDCGEYMIHIIRSSYAYKIISKHRRPTNRISKAVLRRTLVFPRHEVRRLVSAAICRVARAGRA